MDNLRFTIYSGFHNNVDCLMNVWEGIKNQTYNNWEWIISDDFSDDPNDAEVLKKFAENYPNVKYVSPRYKKEFYFNPPVHHSNGDIMLVQDVDDYPHPKLLEVYNYNFNKFPHVEILCCGSAVLNGSLQGNLAHYKYRKYDGIYNISQNYDNFYPMFGDARAYRIRERVPNEFCKEDDFIFEFGDDIIKVFKKETEGSYLFIPRILHYYVQDSKSSISFTKHSQETWDKIHKERNDYLNELTSSIDLDELDSIEYYYNDISDVWMGMINANFYKYPDNFKVDVFNSNLNPRKRKRLKELYFDYDIKYNELRDDSDYIVFEIDSEEDINLFHEFYNPNLSQNISICISNEKYHNTIDEFIGRGFGWMYWGGNKFINL